MDNSVEWLTLEVQSDISVSEGVPRIAIGLVTTLSSKNPSTDSALITTYCNVLTDSKDCRSRTVGLADTVEAVH